jgi:OOP family OmpA-OmpF porin
MKKITLAAVATSAAIACFPSLAMADNVLANPAYLIDGSGNVVHNGSGECWRTGSWTPALATAPCDPVMRAPAVIAAAPKAAEPISAPVTMAKVAPIAQAPTPQKVSFSGDALFAFDKSVLRPESRILLDDLVRQLSGTTSDAVTITGNTDRIGTPQYNQQLSERRAMAVKDYLVSKNIRAGSIEARGMGESQPVTTTAGCKGSKASVKLIACLQPDRRVDVEMTGIKPSADLQ